MRKFSLNTFIKKISSQSMSFIFEDDSISIEQFNITFNILLTIEKHKQNTETNRRFNSYFTTRYNHIRREDFCALITHKHFQSEHLLQILPWLRLNLLDLTRLLRKDLTKQYLSEIEAREQYLQKSTTGIIPPQHQKTCTYKRRSIKRDKFIHDCEQALNHINNLEGGDLLLLLTDPEDLTREVGAMLQKQKAPGNPPNGNEK